MVIDTLRRVKEYYTHQYKERWVFLFMKFIESERVKTVSASSADDFDKELEKVLDDLDQKGIKHELHIAPELGFTVFVKYKLSLKIPETTADKFWLRGEVHRCVECPFYVPPTDGRVKHSECPVTGGYTRKDSVCCDEFYNKLLAGEINLREVVHGEKKKV